MECPLSLTNKRNYKRTMMAAILVILSATFCLILLVKCYDVFIGLTFSESANYPMQMEHVVMDLYPYSGGHMAAKLSRKQISSGSMGYWFTDFDLQSPPKKAVGEYRVILIGGSGAQGQGSPDYSNDQMLYKQLEVKTNQLLRDSGHFVRVINMAMGGSITYQNARDLNLFAHPLEPDMVLSYSGFNDWSVPLWFGRQNQEYWCPNDEKNFRNPTRPYDGGIPFINLLKALFPNLSNINSNINLNAKAGEKSYFERRRFFHRNQRLPLQSKANTFKQVVVPYYVNALKTIKRDFMGIPIMIAWQCIENDPDEFLTLGGNAKHFLGDAFYNNMFDAVMNELAGYYNDKWYFVNVHSKFEYDARLFGLHLTSDAQAIVGEELSSHLSNIILGRTIQE